jgi:hypothetical protein
MRLSMLAFTFSYCKGFILHKIACFDHFWHQSCSVLRLKCYSDAPFGTEYTAAILFLTQPYIWSTTELHDSQFQIHFVKAILYLQYKQDSLLISTMLS